MSIALKNCSILDHEVEIIKSLSWETGNQENWLVTGSNGSGKSVLVKAIAGQLEIRPQAGGFYSNGERGSIAIVSFEEAALLIEEERKRDDSDFVDGGIDHGRTPRKIISEVLDEKDRERWPDGKGLENHEAISLCGISSILDRGLKYLSTGEIRRTLMTRAIATRPRLLILDDPFAGLDQKSRTNLVEFLDTRLGSIRYMLVMDRIAELPKSVTNVIELTERQVSFTGNIRAYKEKNCMVGKENEAPDRSIPGFELPEGQDCLKDEPEILVEMKQVTVSWSERKVLDNLSWTLKRGEHWLIRGPNGSGKTTFLELITGDNPQVFLNDISLFGSRRGSGETIWELKEKMGIVSYRLHSEYRALGDLSLEGVLVSGIHDSIGLYQHYGEMEFALAGKWLNLAGFGGREKTLFRDISYGEQRAILIARAAIKRPPLLILDEPCHGLDEKTKRNILSLLERIAESGSSTILHVTHDPTEALPCEKQILELLPGETPMYRIIKT